MFFRADSLGSIAFPTTTNPPRMRHIARYVRELTGGERSAHMTTKAPPGLIRLDSGSPSFPTPLHICEAGKKAIDEGHTGYILEKGVAVLQEAICEAIARECDLR